MPGGLAQVRELINFQGGDPRFELDAAINPSIVPADVLAVYNAFRAEHSLPAGRRCA